MGKKTSQPARVAEFATADRLHSAAIHLLRRLRVEDPASGLTAPQLSALSVLVFAGPRSMGDLAAAEQVRPPTITHLVKELEGRGLVRRISDRRDRRIQRVSATAKGKRLLQRGRRRRIATLARDLANLPQDERRLLSRAAEILERIALPAGHPGSVMTNLMTEEEKPTG